MGYRCQFAHRKGHEAVKLFQGEPPGASPGKLPESYLCCFLYIKGERGICAFPFSHLFANAVRRRFGTTRYVLRQIISYICVSSIPFSMVRNSSGLNGFVSSTFSTLGLQVIPSAISAISQIILPCFFFGQRSPVATIQCRGGPLPQPDSNA